LNLLPWKQTDTTHRIVVSIKRQKKCQIWLDVTVAGLKKWFALVIVMGLVKKPRMDDY